MALESELASFSKRFQDAKEQRDRHLGEHAIAKDSVNKLLPEYFQMQVEHTERLRKLEAQRRKNEQLNWEHHKVHRDLGMLAKSYDASKNVVQLPQISTPRGRIVLTL